MKQLLTTLTMVMITLTALAQSRPDTLAAEGAWCWFADPRAMHVENGDGTVNASYIGYIDIHGNVRATQVDWVRGHTTEVLVRSYFQPDDHNNPTFLRLPDDRIVIFYTRHTDERCIWYRISLRPGDITDLGPERRIVTEQPTTYPSPFILSADPDHIYLCWRGINWHPTLARLTMPDADDRMTIDRGPFQLVQSTGARPYAKYHSNGRDRICFTYTTGHPDNEWPCWLYYNEVDITDMTLKDVTGQTLARIADGPFKVDKTETYRQRYPATLIDAPTDARNWVWQLSLDPEQHPVVALTRISQDKLAHRYCYARWTGRRWTVSDIADGGHAFHHNWQRTELCYSGGMAIDPDHVQTVYASLPVGEVNELFRLTLDKKGCVKQRQQLTANSSTPNARPYILPGSETSPLRLCWMQGDYYYWMVNRHFPKGYPTAIMTDGKLPPAVRPDSIVYDNPCYGGQTVRLSRDVLLGVDADNRLYVQTGRQRHTSQCRFLTSDDWAHFSEGTRGDSWPTRIGSCHLRLSRDESGYELWRDGMVELKIKQ